MVSLEEDRESLRDLGQFNKEPIRAIYSSVSSLCCNDKSPEDCSRRVRIVTVADSWSVR